jgi:predicted Zn-dependent protease
VKRAVVAASLAALLFLRGAGPARAADAADTNITIDPAIVKASEDADSDAGGSPNADTTSHRPQTPYEEALLNYKAGKYDAAKALIEEADQETPGDVPIEMLKVRILAELHDFHGAHEVINSLYDRPDLTPAYSAALELTSGDLALRERNFDAASRSYENYLQTQPADPDAKLKLVYARLGAGDLIKAGKLASELKPLDAATPAYYFAHAALVHAGAATGDEDEDFQQSRTIYGITVTNRYLKTYLEVFAPKPDASAGANPAPSGKAQ